MKKIIIAIMLFTGLQAYSNLTCNGYDSGAVPRLKTDQGAIHNYISELVKCNIDVSIDINYTSPTTAIEMGRIARFTFTENTESFFGFNSKKILTISYNEFRLGVSATERDIKAKNEFYRITSEFRNNDQNKDIINWEKTYASSGVFKNTFINLDHLTDAQLKKIEDLIITLAKVKSTLPVDPYTDINVGI